MKKYFSTIFTLLFIRTVSAQSPKSDFELMMEQNTQRKTNESDVTLDGIRYHRIEYKNEIYYLKFSRTDESQQDLDVICRETGVLPTHGEAKVDGQVSVSERSSFFISALEDVCKDKQVTVIPVVKLGIRIPDKPKDFLKNKSIFLNLLTQQLGFGANW